MTAAISATRGRVHSVFSHSSADSTAQQAEDFESGVAITGADLGVAGRWTTFELGEILANRMVGLLAHSSEPFGAGIRVSWLRAGASSGEGGG